MSFEKPTPNKESELTNSLKEYIEIAVVPDDLKEELKSIIDQINVNHRISSDYVIGGVANACAKLVPELDAIDDMWKLKQAWSEGLSDQKKKVFSLFIDLRTFVEDNRGKIFEI